MLSVIILNVPNKLFMLSSFMLNVIMLSGAISLFKEIIPFPLKWSSLQKVSKFTANILYRIGPKNKNRLKCLLSVVHEIPGKLG